MNRGVFDTERILADSSYNMLWKPWFKTGEESSVGLSWFLDEYRGVKTIGHAGGDTGFSTNLLMLPEKSIAVVVLCNLNSSPIFRITNAALDILLGDEPEPYQIPAILQVSKELEQTGVEAAQEMWQFLKSKDSGEYNFREHLFTGLHNSMAMKRESEAAMLASLINCSAMIRKIWLFRLQFRCSGKAGVGSNHMWKACLSGELNMIPRSWMIQD